MDALRNRAELLLLKCRKELYFGKLEELKKRCNKEQDDVLRLESSLLSKFRRDFDERLEEEKEEAARATLELELVEKELAELESRIAALEGKSESVSSIYNIEGMDDAEKELFEWCRWAEQGYEVLLSAKACIADGQAARICAYSGPGDRQKNLIFQENVERLMEKLEPFLLTLGRVRYLPGMRMKTIRGTRRNLTMNGKTLMFFWKGHKTFEVDILDFDLRELYGSWAVGDTVDRKLKELSELEGLVSVIMREKLLLGEELLRKVRIQRVQPTEKDIFGFEKER